MMTRHSLDGVATTISTAGAMLREPAFTSTARRPPNSGTVCASSTSRDGLAASSSPSMRTKANGSLGSSTDALHQRFDALAHQPGVGTVHQHDGWRGSGLAMKRSTSAALIGGHRSRIGGTSPRHEIRRQPRADIFRDHLGGAVLGVAQAAVAGEALLLAGNVVGHAREGLPGDDCLAGGDIGQRVGGVDAVVLRCRAARC